MSVPALLESLSTHIFNLSLRHRTAPSSRGPVFPDTGFEPNLLPRFRSNGKRRFLLPRPFATTFIGLHLRMEPLFYPASGLLIPHSSASDSAFVGLGAGPHNPDQEFAAYPPPWPRSHGHPPRRMTRRPRSSPRARPFHFRAAGSILPPGKACRGLAPQSP